MATRTEAFNSISTRIRNLFMASSSFDFLSVKPYTPPSWASHLHPLPSHIFSLAHVCIFILLNQLSIPFNIVNWWNQLPLISLLLLFSVISYQLPTPIHRWNLPNLPTNTEVWLKVNEFIPSFLVIWIDSFIALLTETEILQRDDLSGMQLSGNKVRKLEFLMADAIAQGADSVITIGGIQSNHCRATAVAAKYLNLDPFLILRTSKVI